MRPVSLTAPPSSTWLALTEDHRADRLLVEVQREAEHAALELEHLVDRRCRGDRRPARCRHRPRARGRPAPGRAPARTYSTCWRSAAAISSAIDRQLRHPWLFFFLGGLVGHQICSLSWSRRWRTEPSMTVSPTRATMPPSTLRVDDDLHFDFLAGRLVERLAQPLGLLRRERHRGADLGDLVPVLGRRELDEPVDDLGQLAARPADDDERPRARTLTWSALPPEQVLDDRHPALGRERRVGERHAQLVRCLERAREAEQVVLDVAEHALGAGDFEHAHRAYASTRSLDGTVSCSLPG